MQFINKVKTYYYRSNFAVYFNIKDVDFIHFNISTENLIKQNTTFDFIPIHMTLLKFHDCLMCQKLNLSRQFRMFFLK
ncbi:Uncharacterised protein [Enterobacter hormaechei]|nr:Uncharacterised protein [Enterobacter hormaechei]